MATEMIKRCCELCDAEATVFCESDSAYLCRRCDAEVHGANFLVARHIRRSIISSKQTNHDSIDTTLIDDDDNLDAVSSLSSASVSISTGESSTSDPKSTSSATRNSNHDDDEEISSSRRLRRAPASVDSKIEGVLENWCRRLGQDSNSIVPVTVSVLRAAAKGRRLPGAPFRVALAASFWVGLGLCGGDVRRVEEVTRVPAKVVAAAAARIAPGAAKGKKRKVADREEGWAEC
ncbi:hypothetical protein Droror1_Dr00013335 [Drosera rotundifolia]